MARESQENQCRLLRVLGKKDSDDEEDELYQKYAAGRAGHGKGRGTASENQREKMRKSKPPKPGLTGAARMGQPDPVVLTSKKQKFINIYSEEGEEKIKVPKLPGRHVCECQAREHALINNCLKCGRVVCTQEGSGPCFFCGELVCTNEEEEILNRGSKKSGELRRQLMSGAVVRSLNEMDGTDVGPIVSDGGKKTLAEVGKGLSKALDEKNRLLSYDKDTYYFFSRSCAKRTRVIDDQADFFKMGPDKWMSPEERAVATKLRDEKMAQLSTPRSQRDTKITLDFAGRQVVEEAEEGLSFEEQEDMYNALVERTKRALYTGAEQDITIAEHSIARGGILLTQGSHTSFQPQYKETEDRVTSSEEGARRESGGVGGRMRLQDHTGMREVAEGGFCLSMHQPFASLLIRGIKKYYSFYAPREPFTAPVLATLGSIPVHEGRSWYTAHRGVLWIAATAKVCTREESKELENFYLRYYDDSLPAPFPESYPSGCLLGCVEVLDCLPQEQYLKQFPGGESDSAYVLICEDAKELPVKMPNRGQHKIYKLDTNIHQAAKKLIGQGFQVGWKK